MIALTDCENVKFYNTTVQNNTASLNSFMTSSSSNIDFDRMSIYDNHGGEVTLSATYSTLVFNNTVFDGNTASLVSNGFLMVNSNVELRNTLIQNSLSDNSEVGFFNMMIQSNLQILDNSVIRNISAQINGLILSATESNITIAKNVSITDCESKASTPTISVSNSQNFTIADDVYFSDHKPSVIRGMQSRVYIKYSEFTNSVGN